MPSPTGTLCISWLPNLCTGTPRICRLIIMGYILFHDVTFPEIRGRKGARFLYSP